MIMNSIVLFIALCLGIYIEIIYIIEKKELLKNINYKIKYDEQKAENKILKNDIKELRSQVLDYIDKLSYEQDKNKRLVDKVKDLPKKTKAKLGFIKIK